MSKNGLVAVKRPNKNGVMVTKWVKPETVAGPNAAAIGAPTLTKKPKSYKGFQSSLIANSDDPRVQSGEVFDRIVHDGKIYSRSREGVTPHAPESIRVQLSRPLTTDEEDRIASLTGYAWKVKMRPDRYAEAVEVQAVDSKYSVIMSVDLYRENPRSNEHRSLQQFESELHTMFAEGTPVRSTDKAGPGTAGTRLLSGLEGDDLSVEVYYDSVEGDMVTEVARERETTDIETLDSVLGHDVPALAEGML